jgi:hypothetical protein
MGCPSALSRVQRSHVVGFIMRDYISLKIEQFLFVKNRKYEIIVMIFFFFEQTQCPAAPLIYIENACTNHD